MRKTTKLKIIFERIFNKFVKVDNIEKVEEGLKRQKEALKKLNNSYYNAIGALDSYKEEMKKNESNLNKLEKCFNICKTKEDKEGAKQVYDETVTTKQRITVLKEQIEKQKLIVERFKEAKEKYEKEIRNLQNNLETMKSKSRFSKAVKEYNENFGEFEEFNIDDIQRDIDVEFNASNAKLSEQTNAIDLEKIEEDMNFEEMWRKSNERNNV